MENTRVGPFLIVKKLGTNRRHHVYHARQIEQKRDVAMKFISIPPDVEWGRALDKIEREVEALQQLDHPGLVKVFGAGVHEDRIFFASELIEGESLTSVLARRGKLPHDLVVEYGRQIADVLRYLHQRDLIHSKLTPDKILVTPDNQIRIADLRLNRARRRRWDAVKRRELDIAAYMAPEQFTEGATHKSDLYALGVILFEMLTGKLPYALDTLGRMTRSKIKTAAPSVTEHVMNCPVWLDKIIRQMLNPKPRQRPHSARAVSMAFEEIGNFNANRKSTVDQVSGSFNPLNAGADKSEARRLLGHEEEARSVGLPFYQRTPFLVTSLLAITAFLVYVAIPESDQTIIDDARTQISSPDSRQWTLAREKLEPVVDRGGPASEVAESLFFESRKKTLLKHAREGVSHDLQTPTAKLFVAAVQLELADQADDAIAIFADLIDTVDPDGNERHIRTASIERLEMLTQNVNLPTAQDSLLSLISEAVAAETPGELLASRTKLAAIAMRFAGEPEYDEVLAVTQRALNVVKQKIARLKVHAAEANDPKI